MAEKVDVDEADLPSIPLDSPDEQANEVDRIDRFARSEIFVQRLYHVCYMAEAAQRAGYEGAAPVFVPLCKELSVDDEPEIRQALAEQLPQLARIFASDGTDAALRDVAILLQITNTLLTDDCEEVQLAAEQAFSEMAHVVRSIGGDMQNDMLGIVLELADSKEEAQRVCAANLLTGFAEGLERGPFELRAVPKIIALAADSEFRVRKAVALGLPRCCKALSESPSTVDELLLPVYVSLSQDTVWAVRMACAEGIVRIAEVVSPEARAVHLAATIERLARDASNWVRDSALQMLGPLLAMLQGTQERLVALFTSMAEPFPGDNRLRLYCAFNFPAVVQSLGPHRWQELEGAYRTLLGSEQAAVRRTLGYSLHELAQVLGGELSEAYLLPAFRAFMADIDEVRMGVAKNLVPFIATLPKPSRVQCVQLLPTVAYRDSHTAASSPTRLPPPLPIAAAPVLPEPPPTPDAGLPSTTGQVPPVNVVDSGVPLIGSSTPEAAKVGAGEEERPPEERTAGGEGRGTRSSSPGEAGGEAGSSGAAEGGGPLPTLPLRAGSQGESSGRWGQRPTVRVVDCRSLWHLRRLVAEQLHDIAGLLDFSDVNSILIPFVLELSRDPVAAVRSEAAKQAGRLACHMAQAAEGREELSAAVGAVLAHLRELASSRRFRDRQMFGAACMELVKGLSAPMFVDELLSSLVLVSQDPTPNVRVRAGEALVEVASCSEELRANQTVQTALQRLAADSDRDVAAVAQQAPVPGQGQGQGQGQAQEQGQEGAEAIHPPPVEGPADCSGVQYVAKYAVADETSAEGSGAGTSSGEVEMGEEIGEEDHSQKDAGKGKLDEFLDAIGVTALKNLSLERSAPKKTPPLKRTKDDEDKVPP